MVIGGGMAGLSAAIHLALQGRRVTLLESNDRLGGRANRLEMLGYKFDTGPSLLNYPWVFENLFRNAGRDLTDYLELIPVDPSVEFRWPDATVFSLSSDFVKLQSECERIEPGCAPRLAAWLRDAGAKYDLAFEKLVTHNADSAVAWFSRLSLPEMWLTGIWRSLDRELGRFFRSRYIREAFGSYAMYLGGSPFELPGTFSILAYGELAYGLWLPKGGVYSLTLALERLAEELGVTIRKRSRANEIWLRDGRVNGVILETGECLAAELVVSNVDVPTTEQELLRIKPRKVRMTPGVLTFYWGVPSRLPNLRHHTIFLPNEFRRAFEQLSQGRIPDELPFYVSIASETDAELAPPGCSTVFVLVPTPLLSQLPNLDWEEAAATVKYRVLERIGLAPQQIECEQVWTPRDWSERFGLYDGSAFGAAHTRFQIGPWRSSNASKVPGLFYTGASTTPGTGMPMAVLSGQMTAERVAAYAH